MKKEEIWRRATVIDLFCGIGGLSHGFFREGFDIAAGIDLDETCRYAYEHNNKAQFYQRDAAAENVAEFISSTYQEKTEQPIKILIGCAPCQPFSKYTRNKPSDEARQPDTINSSQRTLSRSVDWQLVKRFIEIIEAVKPHIVSMENVPELSKHPVFETFITTLEKSYPHISKSVVDCTKYGVPQTRERLVVIASTFGDIQLIPHTHTSPVTVRHAIGALQPIAAGTASPEDKVHRASKLSELNLRRIRRTPQGGGWSDWPEELKLECHKKVTGETYRSVYGRMHWDQPAPTMTTECNGLGNGRFGHPDQDRAISLREAALIQSFPETYVFLGEDDEVIIKNLARQIGNAVPVLLAQVIAQSIKRHLVDNRITVARLIDGSLDKSATELPHVSSEVKR